MDNAFVIITRIPPKSDLITGLPPFSINYSRAPLRPGPSAGEWQMPRRVSVAVAVRHRIGTAIRGCVRGLYEL